MSFFLNCNFHFEMIIGSHKIIRNSTEKFHIPFTQVSSVVTSRTTIVQYHCQDIDKPLTLFIFATCIHLCVCVYVFYSFITWVCSSNNAHSQDTEQFCHQEEPSHFLLVTTPCPSHVSSPPPLPLLASKHH